MKLLSVGRDAKTVKGQGEGYLTGILYLAPARLSGYEVCPQRSAGCTAGCLNTAGQGVFSNVQRARIAKTKRYFEDRTAFLMDLMTDIAALSRKAFREGKVPVVRLNGTSDIPWERVSVREALNRLPWSKLSRPYAKDAQPWGCETIFDVFPEIQFYDYTKRHQRALDACRSWGSWPRNYALTFSKAEDNDDTVNAVMASGGNVSVVFRGELPDTFNGHTVVDGDKNDLRFLDPPCSVVGLKAKGQARKDTSGFVVD